MGAARRLTHADVRRIALALPDTVEGSHNGDDDLRVGGKIFVGLRATAPERVNLKSTSTVVDALVRADPDSYRDAWGGTWLGVDLARVSRTALRELITDAWELARQR